MLEEGKKGRKELRTSRAITAEKWKERMGEGRKREIALIAVKKCIRL